uniref:Calmodulin binding protein C-terminal domain-containing protein n=1 Tax=Davidia involucrata TaxID=16924 RepID=A0A5B6ZVL7_DAVIN
MSNKMWDVLVEHAKTCVLSGKLYVYYSDDVRNVGVVFNNIYELSGLIAGGQYYSADSLSDVQKVYVDTLVKKAYDNWMHVIEYDGKSLVSFEQNKSLGASRSDVTMGAQDFSNSFDHELTLPSLPVSIPLEQPSMNPGLSIGGYDDSMGPRYPIQSQNVNLNAPIQFDGTSFPLHNQLIGASQQSQSSRSENVLALGPSQSSTPGFQTGGTSNLTSYRGFDDFFPEEEIRMRSHEMLENEDMQHLLRIFNMGGQGHHASINVSEDSYPYASEYMPHASSDYSFDEERTRSSGKAVVGWLKLKAALRWGIFIRKKAAERRAQLVELED